MKFQEENQYQIDSTKNPINQISAQKQLPINKKLTNHAHKF
jgi:hypothetical protein